MLLVRKIMALTFCLALAGCSNDSTDDLIADPISSETIITYSGNVATIINNNCVACHNLPPVNGAPMPLTTYAHVKDAVQNRGLIDRISRPQGASGMMPNLGTRLPQPLIDIIIQWEEQGFQE